MGRSNGNVNTGAVVGVLGALVFVIGLCGTIGSFLLASAEGRGGWTVFYGAIVWGFVQMICGFVIAGRDKQRREGYDDEDGETRPSRRRKTVQQPSPIPVPVVIGCGVAGGLLLFCLGGFAVVMIVIQSLPKSDPDKAQGTPPPPRNGNPVGPVEPVPEDLGSKEAQTQIAGATSDPTFKDQAPDDGVLIGLDVGLAEAFGVELVRAIQPRYQTSKGEVMGRQFGTNFTKTISVKAKPGYAVGAINVKAGLVVNGFSIKFMRIKGNALDPTDSYSSVWIGDQTGGSGPTLLGGDGTQIIGIIGKRNSQDCNGLGLLKRH